MNAKFTCCLLALLLVSSTSAQRFTVGTVFRGVFRPSTGELTTPLTGTVAVQRAPNADTVVESDSATEVPVTSTAVAPDSDSALEEVVTPAAEAPDSGAAPEVVMTPAAEAPESASVPADATPTAEAPDSDSGSGSLEVSTAEAPASAR